MLRETAALEGKALDWAVNDCLQPDEEGREFYRNLPCFVECRPYSTDWSLAGPIIERERLLLQPEIGKEGAGNAWSAIAIAGTEQFGHTPIVAAMRCYVASKLGKTVDIPDELI